MRSYRWFGLNTSNQDKAAENVSQSDREDKNSKTPGDLVDGFQNKEEKYDHMKQLLKEVESAGKNIKHKNILDLVNTLLGR